MIALKRLPRIRQLQIWHFYSTIYAVSSGQGKCGVAVIRVSGLRAKSALINMTKKAQLPEPRKAVLNFINDPKTGENIDRGLVLWFPGPNSFTGEDCCEFQVHGGKAVVSAILSGLSKLETFRPALPGEFTRRAFMAGKLDLTAVEGLADLIHAETEQQRRQALLQMQGNLGKLYEDWRERLIKNTAHIEAFIDFSEEENFEENRLYDIFKSNEILTKEIEQHLNDGRQGQRLHDGVRAVILGEPNVGKSTLLNYLVGRSAAIVSPVEGTTRDVVEIPINIGGFPLVLADTAGQRSRPNDEIEKEGIFRAQAWAKTADLSIIVVDAAKVLMNKNNVNEESLKIKFGAAASTDQIILANKIDLLDKKSRDYLYLFNEVIPISCTTNEGLDKLNSHLMQKLQILCGTPSRESPGWTQERHKHHLEKCLINLRKTYYSSSELNLTFAANYLRKAANQLGCITGKTSNEHILDVIFKDFCIGK